MHETVEMVWSVDGVFVGFDCGFGVLEGGLVRRFDDGLVGVDGGLDVFMGFEGGLTGDGRLCKERSGGRTLLLCSVTGVLEVHPLTF